MDEHEERRRADVLWHGGLGRASLHFSGRLRHGGGVHAVICCVALLAWMPALFGADAVPRRSSTWPREYTIQRDESAGILALGTPYYRVEHDLKKGGAISRISLVNGRAANLLVRPVEARIQDANGVVLADSGDAAPVVTQRQEGLGAVVTVDCALVGDNGMSSGIRVKTRYTYRWGYVKIQRQFIVSTSGVRVKELCPLATVLAPSLSQYGYREGLSEADGSPPFSFGSNRWGRLSAAQPSEGRLDTRFVPRSMLFVDAGVEGLEWFAGSELKQWEMPLDGRRGQGRCRLEASADPPGWALSISPVWNQEAAVPLPESCVFDYYLAVPLLEGAAQGPWLHTSFNRNRGNWVSPEAIRRWAEKGIQTVHCHNDGDYYDDGLFWRDGAYPPYPDMDAYDKVLAECRRAGIRTATYFSNKELHPSTKEFQEHGEAWGRKDRQGKLQHNFFRPNSEFGAQMCLRSGWLDFLKLSIDRVLKNHPLDGVYYDWNVALFCCNPLHESLAESGSAAQGHWDIDELLELMEWTRNRVGPDGLVIVHNTTAPMFAMENFADYVVATEWGYGNWTTGVPDLPELPLEWSLAGARPRGVISYGVLDSQAPRRLHRLFALQALLGGVTPWPASEDAFELRALLNPVGDFKTYRFADWRNDAVSLSDDRCASAIYSRPGEAYLLLANLDQNKRDVACQLHLERLPHALAAPAAATRLAARPASSATGQPADVDLDVRQLTGGGLKIELPGDDAVLIHIRGERQ
ncbi:MAG: hypothetical protein FJ276_09205 [Planctomycetes bacterium]|nr:hypothetical protein [Planctomycetota bacterium]